MVRLHNLKYVSLLSDIGHNTEHHINVKTKDYNKERAIECNRAIDLPSGFTDTIGSD